LSLVMKLVNLQSSEEIGHVVLILSVTGSNEVGKHHGQQIRIGVNLAGIVRQKLAN
jgi:hypothetical protein